MQSLGINSPEEMHAAQDATQDNPAFKQAQQAYQQKQTQALGQWWAGATPGQRSAYMTSGAPLGVGGLSAEDINNYSGQGAASGYGTGSPGVWTQADLNSMQQSLAPIQQQLGSAPDWTHYYQPGSAATKPPQGPSAGVFGQTVRTMGG
jgi:hypothetical protein